MPDTPKKFYLTTPIYYVNARPHIGHAYSTIAADVIARRHRLLGGDTFFLTGTDEHGQKVQRSAAAAGIPPQQFADEVSKTFSDLWARMGITNDDFIRTTDPRHKRGVQKLWTTLVDAGAIYLSSYTGQYSVGEEMFVDGPPGTIGPDGKPTETVTEENYFFRLSDYQEKLIDLIEDGKLHIQPETVRNEVLSFLRGNVASVITEVHDRTMHEPTSPNPIKIALYEGILKEPTTRGYYVPGALKDLSISRTTFSWGIPVPGDEKHVIYVWLDALANYMTAVGYGSDDPADIAKFAKYWPADLHLVGKEITRFHCVYWPAFLMAAGLPLPKTVVANGWLLFEESKMSKSRGNVVRTETILDAFGPLCPAPPSAVLLKGTASAVPQTSPIDGPASAAEVTPPAGQAEPVPQRLKPQTTSALDGTAEAVPLSKATKAQQDLFASDVIRYFLLREIPFGQDGSFSFDALITRYNADLANGYGNLVSRSFKMISNYFGDLVPEVAPQIIEKVIMLVNLQATFGWKEELLAPLYRDFEERRFERYLQGIGVFISVTDETISTMAPWKPKTTDQLTLENRQYCLVYSWQMIRIITALLYPILPYATASVWCQLGLGDIEEAARKGGLKDLTWGGLPPGTKLSSLAPIFPRADKGLAQIMTDMETADQKPKAPEPSPLTDEFSDVTPVTPAEPVPTDPSAGPRTATLPIDNPGGTVGGSHALTTERPGTPPHAEAQASGIFATKPDTQQISIDDFVKIDLRVAQIVVAERIPKADKLLRLEVDLGFEKRQILSGIAEWYTPEELLGRRIAVIANLAPRKMRGLESHGMLLAASGEDHTSKPILATFSDEIPLGSRIR